MPSVPLTYSLSWFLNRAIISESLIPMIQPDLSTVHSHLLALYGQSVGEETFERLRLILNGYQGPPAFSGEGNSLLSERDSILITYADQLREPHVFPLRTLTDFCEGYLSGLVNCIHILPFYPYSSDDGFSVIDYREVNPEFGHWGHISHLSRRFRLMFDAVINRTVRFPETTVAGEPITTYAPSSTGAKAYRDLAKEVLDGAQAREHA